MAPESQLSNGVIGTDPVLQNVSFVIDAECFKGAFNPAWSPWSSRKWEGGTVIDQKIRVQKRIPEARLAQANE